MVLEAQIVPIDRRLSQLGTLRNDSLDGSDRRNPWPPLRTEKSTTVRRHRP